MIENSENLLVDLMNVHAIAINKEMENMLPCVITEVVSRNKVTVTPLINVVDKSGNSYPRAAIEGVPVLSGGAGDMLISMPVSVGSIGWIHASDRDISLFLQSYEASDPSTQRMHNFSDSYFVPDLMHNFDVSEEDVNAIVIQNRDGKVKISIDGTNIKIVNNEVSIVVDGSSVKGIAKGGFDLNGFIINEDGSAKSPVSLTSPSMVVDGKELAGHTHSKGTYLDAEGRPLTGNSGTNN